MVASRTIFVFFLCPLMAVVTEKLNPLSDGFIHLINSRQNSWKTGRNFPVHTPFSYIKNLMASLEDENFAKLPKMEHDAELIASLPESFDPRDKWPNCPSLNEIRDQGACGRRVRYCRSNDRPVLHTLQRTTLLCSSNCDSSCQYGGTMSSAWSYWNSTGIVSGGNYNSNKACRPYAIAACEHYVPGKLPLRGKKVDTPECVEACESSYSTDYDKDKRCGKQVYTVPSDEEQIKAELFKNGPVEAGYVVFNDFITYRDRESDFVGRHAVKMLGWGVESGEKYWLMANSWNPNWGNKGFFKILRGEGHCGIESKIIAGEPLI